MIVEVSDLIQLEAALLDDCRYAEWIELFTDDCLYWVPVSPEMQSPRDGPSHFRDDRQVMMVRTHRLANPRSFGAEPSPRTVHIISGIRIEESTPEEIHVSSSQIMLEYRNRGRFEEDQRAFGGRVRHRLLRTAEGLRIAEKRIDLINAEGAFNAMAAPL
ncbi:MAG: aromatic-ring-hydroxylating dioxygenase subunit beta [Sphingomonadaceae bacterium]|nr:aromatic-ring-hydroxylating dioxygenase subunit beta [Sphingomonadaceae bacterium]